MYVSVYGVVPSAFENEENITILVIFLVASELSLCLTCTLCSSSDGLSRSRSDLTTFAEYESRPFVKLINFSFFLSSFYQ
jgi:hypothetical protein